MGQGDKQQKHTNSRKRSQEDRWIAYGAACRGCRSSNISKSLFSAAKDHKPCNRLDSLSLLLIRFTILRRPDDGCCSSSFPTLILLSRTSNISCFFAHLMFILPSLLSSTFIIPCSPIYSRCHRTDGRLDTLLWSSISSSLRKGLQTLTDSPSPIFSEALIISLATLSCKQM